MAVTIGHCTGAMVWVQWPGLMAAMLHAVRWKLRPDVGADAGRPGGLRFRSCGRLWSRRRTVSGDAVL